MYTLRLCCHLCEPDPISDAQINNVYGRTFFDSCQVSAGTVACFWINCSALSWAYLCYSRIVLYSMFEEKSPSG